MCAAGLGGLAFGDVEPLPAAEVRGARHVTAERARAVARVDGVPVFVASAAEARTLLLGIPAVREASVELAFPAAARITLVEREAAGRWVVGDVEWFVDADGVLFASSDPTAAPALRVRDGRAASRSAGERLDPALVAAALRLAKVGPGELRRDATAPSVRIEPGVKGLVLDSGAGWEVRFGTAERIEEKLELLLRFLREQPERRLEYVDVHRTDQIVFCPDATSFCAE